MATRASQSCLKLGLIAFFSFHPQFKQTNEAQSKVLTTVKTPRKSGFPPYMAISVISPQDNYKPPLSKTNEGKQALEMISSQPNTLKYFLFSMFGLTGMVTVHLTSGQLISTSVSPYEGQFTIHQQHMIYSHCKDKDTEKEGNIKSYFAQT